MIVVTAAQMQDIDQQTIAEFGIPGRVLMENAGRGATRCFLERIYSRGSGSVGILAGPGNNGGDGFVMARYLAHRDVAVVVFLLGQKNRVKGDAAANLDLLAALEVEVVELPDSRTLAAHQGRMHHIAYWIDALLGTGLKAEVRGHYKEAIAFINAQERPVLAVDIPSGLHADTGQPCGICIKADATVTFGSPKIGHLVQPGAAYCGDLELIDIGIPPMITRRVGPQVHLLTGSHVRRVLPRRTIDAHKGQTGHALVIAGSAGKTGAAAMTAMTALRAGAGLVTLGIGVSISAVLETLTIEAMTLPLADDENGALGPQVYDAIRLASQGKQCLALGPGLGISDATGQLVATLVKEIDLPMVIDADGLNHLAGRLDLLDQRQSPTILTPHPGEMARLCGLSTLEIQQDRISAARDLAAGHGVHVVLKGAGTVVAEPDGRVWINSTGNSGMAGGGMGDVLTGTIAGLLAQGSLPLEASLAAVYLHGLAADMLAAESPWGYLATEVMETLPLAIGKVLSDPPPSPINLPIY